MWKLAIAITLAAAVGVEGLSVQDWCWCSLTANFKHTFSAPCKNQVGANPGAVLNCAWATFTEYSCMLIDLLVERHNDLRRKVASGRETRGLGGGQPPAADMQQLAWDWMEANAIGDLFLNCSNKFDSTCVDWDSLNEQGFNTMVYYNTTLSTFDAWKNTIDAWYSEVDKFNSSNIPNYKDKMGTGNYTHMMDADVKSIVCVSFLSYDTSSLLPMHRIQACKYFNKDGIYSPVKPGKAKGTPLYTVGKPCSRCEGKGRKLRCFQHFLCQNFGHAYYFDIEYGEQLCSTINRTVTLEPLD